MFVDLKQSTFGRTVRLSAVKESLRTENILNRGLDLAQENDDVLGYRTK